MKIKLAEGRRLRDPFTKVHMRPDEVRDVQLTMFWRRRLRDGDVVSAEPEPEPEPKPEPEPAPAPAAETAETAAAY